jgi:hypothetical protein
VRPVALARKQARKARTLAPLPPGTKPSFKSVLLSRGQAAAIPRIHRPQPWRSGFFSQNPSASPSKCKHKARLRLHERGLTLPSSGPAYGSPLKSNVRRRKTPCSHSLREYRGAAEIASCCNAMARKSRVFMHRKLQRPLRLQKGGRKVPNDKTYWFPAKRYGWGWGLPTVWQG